MTLQQTDLNLTVGIGLVAMLEDGAFLLAGLGDDVPDTVEVRPNGDPALSWNAAAVSWPLIRPADGVHAGFVAIFPLPSRERAGLKSIVLRTRGKPVALNLRKPAGGIDAIFAAVATEAGPSWGRVVDGLVEILLAEDAGPARARAATRLLATAARSTGYIEIVGAAAPGEVFVQGWATDLPAGSTRVLAVGDPPATAELIAATYQRQDLSGRARGFAGIVESLPLASPEALKQLYFRADDGWRTIDIYDRRTSLGARDVPAHLRGLLAQATAPEDALNRLRRAAHRFDGRETVSQARQPVRLGIDLAVAADTGGILVAGWMLDPRGAVRSVRVSAGAVSAEIGADWTRLPRDDVASAFASDPQFRGFVAGKPLSGFLAFAPGVVPVDGETRIELDLGDGEPPCYFPIEVSRAPLKEALAGLLAAIDPRTAAAERAVDRQFAPMFRSAQTSRSPAKVIERYGTNAAGEAPLALVVGADRRVADTVSLLAILATDPHARSLPIIFAAPGDALDAVAGEIARLARFYRLSVDLVACQHAATAVDALVAGAGLPTAPTLALLSADTLPLTSDWLPRLLAAHRLRGERHLVCPTILFEDRSLRWAGAWRDDDGNVGMPNLGLPADVVSGIDPREVAAGTLECCIVPRSAIAFLADEPGTSLLGAAARNLHLALRIHGAGTPAIWVPDVMMIAAGDGGGTPSPLARRIDERLLDALHAPAAPAMAG